MISNTSVNVSDSGTSGIKINKDVIKPGVKTNIMGSGLNSANASMNVTDSGTSSPSFKSSNVGHREINSTVIKPGVNSNVVKPGFNSANTSINVADSGTGTSISSSFAKTVTSGAVAGAKPLENISAFSNEQAAGFVSGANSVESISETTGNVETENLLKTGLNSTNTSVDVTNSGTGTPISSSSNQGNTHTEEVRNVVSSSSSNSGTSSYSSGFSPNASNISTSKSENGNSTIINYNGDILQLKNAFLNSEQSILELWNNIKSEISTNIENSWIAEEAKKYTEKVIEYDTKVVSACDGLKYISETFDKAIKEIENTNSDLSSKINNL